MGLGTVIGQFVADRRAATMVEYAFVAGLTAAVVLTGANSLGQTISGKITGGLLGGAPKACVVDITAE